MPESSLDTDGERKGSLCASLPDYWMFNLVDASYPGGSGPLDARGATWKPVSPG